MNFEYEVYLEDDIIAIHKHDDTFVDISIKTYFRWLKHNELNFHKNESFVAYKLNESEYFGMNDYQTIKEHIKLFMQETKFKNYKS